MKTLCTFVCALLICHFAVNAQIATVDTTHANTYLFAEFKPGYVLMKSKSVEKADLNYNAYDQQIVYTQGNQVLTLVEIETVDTVFFGGRKFIPVKKSFYEIVEQGEVVNLLVSYDAKIKPVSATQQHDGSTRKSSNEVMNTITSTNVSRSRYQNDFEVEIIRKFRLQRFKDLYKANSQAQVVKAFPDYLSDKIKQYFADNEVDLKDPEQLIELIHFANAK